MKYIKIQQTDLLASNIVLGCMRLCSLSRKEAEIFLQNAIDEGINFFDHADIYGDGACETLFSEALDLSGSMREKIIIQSKCGIRKFGYDFSKEHILNSVDQILTRLKTGYLDLLLLHRPDPLMEPEEVAEAFVKLHDSGKVRYFGVSNHNPCQIELLKRSLPYPLVVNQLQFGAAHTPLIDAGMTVNMKTEASADRTGSLMEYCRLHSITPQAWSPFQRGFFEGAFLGDQKNYKELNEVIGQIAQKYGVSATAVAVGWITRHPANIQVILGSTKKERITEGCAGSELALSREDWYAIYRAAGNMIP